MGVGLVTWKFWAPRVTLPRDRKWNLPEAWPEAGTMLLLLDCIGPAVTEPTCIQEEELQTPPLDTRRTKEFGWLDKLDVQEPTLGTEGTPK